MEFVDELTGLLQAEWNVSLALYLTTELGVSDNDYLRFRLAMSKVYADGRWQVQGRGDWHQAVASAAARGALAVAVSLAGLQRTLRPRHDGWYKACAYRDHHHFLGQNQFASCFKLR
eukprot:1425838-Pleurochrysis_carterae.AAC.1